MIIQVEIFPLWEFAVLQWFCYYTVIVATDSVTDNVGTSYSPQIKQMKVQKEYIFVYLFIYTLHTKKCFSSTLYPRYMCLWLYKLMIRKTLVFFL